MNRRATTMAIATLGIFSAGGGVVGATALGAGEPQGPPAGTLEFDFRAGPIVGRNAARPTRAPGAPRAGDIITVRGPISRDGKRIGVADATLTFHGGTPTFVVVYTFANGDQLIAEGATTEEGTTPGAIIGGTGAYAGARGETVETLKDRKTGLYHETARFIP